MLTHEIQLHVDTVVENTELPVVLENTEPVIVGHIDKNFIWLINYEQELQGLLLTDSSKAKSPYYTIHSAL